MKNLQGIAMLIPVLAVSAALAPTLKADAWNDLTKVTFSGPVEIPGRVLPAGTYWFKLMDSPSDRNIVQIFGANQTKLDATILAIPDFRLKPTGKTVITFAERPTGSPEAMKAWFYPGSQYGQEFVYPKSRAVELAKAVKEPVASMPANLEANTKMPAKKSSEPQVMAMKHAVVKAQQPNGGEVEVVQVFTPPPAELLAQNKAPAQRPASLPHSAGTIPLLALLGLILTGTGFSLRFAAKRIH